MESGQRKTHCEEKDREVRRGRRKTHMRGEGERGGERTEKDTHVRRRTER